MANITSAYYNVLMNNEEYINQRNKVLEKKQNASAYAKLKQDKSKTIRKPEWLKVPLPTGENYRSVKKDLRDKNLWTVCEEASCPNLSECWSKKTATMMILGGTCTRACKFCHVDTGNPKGVVDYSEPQNAADMVGTMGT